MPFSDKHNRINQSQMSFWSQLNAFLRALIPGGVTLILILISVAPTRLPGFIHVAPMVALISIYFWAVTRPAAIGYVVAFLLGIVEDSLTGIPLGTSSIILLLVQATIASQASFFRGKPFLVTWSGFFLVAIACAILKWLILSGFYLHPMDIYPLGFATTLTITLYPLFTWILGVVNQLTYGGQDK